MSTDMTRAGSGDTNMGRVYAGVIALEAIVLAGIWLFQRYFGA
jgi:flagellar biogenesis protein FliO